MVSQHQIILGDYINPISDKSSELVRGGAIVLKKARHGWVISDKGHKEKILKKYGTARVQKVLDYSDYLLLPGFYDMHFHWVQDDVRLMPKDSLLTWLSTYTWPYESKFKSKRYTKQRVKRFAQELASVGTLGGACYSSLHGHTVDEALDHFVGDFIVGNVLMTMNSPTYLLQTKKNALEIIREKAKKFKSRYAMTPRFAPTTHPEVMKEGAKIARKNHSFIQTHLSETPQEIDYVLSMYRELPGFEDVTSYTEIYQRCDILGAQTIMGHGIHLSPKELTLLKKTKTKIAHCPTSNAPVKQGGLGSGLFDFIKTEKAKIDWALASDIGGGPFLSMFDVMRSFVAQNKKNQQATYQKALYRSTLAGAKMLGLEQTSGSLDKEKFANFIAVESPKKKKGESAETVLEQLIKTCAKNRAGYSDLVEMTYFKGELIFSRDQDLELK